MTGNILSAFLLLLTVVSHVNGFFDDMANSDQVLVQRPLNEGIRWNEGVIPEGESEYTTGVQSDALTGVVMARNEYIESSKISHKYKCDIMKKYSKNCEYNIVVAISNCIPRHFIKRFKTWIERVKIANERLMTRNHRCWPKFRIKILKSCRALKPNLIKHALLSEEEVPEMTNEELVDTMKEHGHVELLDNFKVRVRTTALVSLFGDKKTYTQILAFEKLHKIKHYFNFRYCRKGKNCEGKWKKCVVLKNIAEIVHYSPFKIIQTFHCRDVLPGGVPITYVNHKHQRKCYCHCPSGFKNVYGRCKPIKEKCKCRWNRRKYFHAYTAKNPPPKTCKMRNWTANKIIKYIPYPKSNYVAGGRKNSFDYLYYIKHGSVQRGPRIVVKVKQYKYCKGYWNRRHKLRKHRHRQYGKHGRKWRRGRRRHGKHSRKWRRGRRRHGKHSRKWRRGRRHYGKHSWKWQKKHGGRRGWKKNHRCKKTVLEFAFPWRVFQYDRYKIFDKIRLTVPGRYKIYVLAYDYAGKPAKCKTCLAINDNFRPIPILKCPKGFCDRSQKGFCKGDAPSAEYNYKNIAKANIIVNKHFKYSEKVKNDNCGRKRCDRKRFYIKDFFSKRFVNKPWKKGKKCFNKKLNKKQRRIMKSPFGKHNQHIHRRDPLRGKKFCTRCCQYETTLKEWWIDYTCGKKMKKACDGTAKKCVTTQCLVGFGYTYFCAKMGFKTPIKKCTKKLIKHNFPHSGYNSETQAHFTTKCTKFNRFKRKCVVKKRLGQLLYKNVLQKNKHIFWGNPERFVKFRYRIQGSSKWRPYNKRHLLKFFNPVTCIYIEAWSKCGLVKKFYFYVYLHTHQRINVQEQFRNMWYQATVSRSTPGTMCNYKKSDFAELTFDYHPEQALKYKRHQVTWKTTRVRCWMKYKNKTPVQILDSRMKNEQIVKHFSIEMVHKPKTKRFTNIHIDCKFVFVGFKGIEREENAWIKFTIKNCDDPHWDCPYGKCSDSCKWRKRRVYQACGGNQIYHTKRSTKFTTRDRKCCKKCGWADCVSILGKPDTSDLKRCEVKGKWGGKWKRHGRSYERRHRKKKVHRPKSWASEWFHSKFIQTSESMNVGSGFFAFTVVGVVAGLAVTLRKRNQEQQMLEESEGYSPLLQ